MWDEFYSPHRAEHNPLHNDDCIYTPGVVVFKTDTASPSLMPEDEWFSVDVISRYMHSFKTIEFAVYCSSRDDSNFKVFERTMK